MLIMHADNIALEYVVTKNADGSLTMKRATLRDLINRIAELEFKVAHLETVVEEYSNENSRAAPRIP